MLCCALYLLFDRVLLSDSLPILPLTGCPSIHALVMSLQAMLVLRVGLFV